MRKITETPEGLEFAGAGGGKTVIVYPPNTQTEAKYIDVGNISGGGVASVVAGTNVTVDNSDPANPVVSASGGGTEYTLESDFTVISSTTYAATGVEFAVAANSLYVVDIYAHAVVTGASLAQPRITLGAAGGASLSALPSGIISMNGNTSNVQAALLSAGRPWPTSYQNGGGDMGYFIAVVATINAGTMQLRFAQQSSVASNTVLKAGTKISVRKVL
jgi:hypothetical protein